MLNSAVGSRDSELLEVAARLRVAIFRAARRLRQEAGAELGPALLAALGTIERHGPVTPSELADLEGVKRPTATRMIARLETEGLIDRARDPMDRRSSLVSVGPAGAALLRRLRKRRTAYLARRLRELGPADVAVLARATEVLERMIEGERR
jgi:DNA-binding MarR family transcriptional regulator